MTDPDIEHIIQTLGHRIRHLRHALHISQEELGRRAGLHRTYIGMVERGERNITLVTLYKIAAALQTSILTLLDDTLPDD